MSKEELEQLAESMRYAANMALKQWNDGKQNLAIGELTGFVRGVASALAARAASVKEEVKP